MYINKRRDCLYICEFVFMLNYIQIIFVNTRYNKINYKISIYVLLSGIIRKDVKEK